MDPNATTSIAQLQLVAMRYGGGADVLHGVCLSLAPGSFHFLVGPERRGKDLAPARPLPGPARLRGRVILFGRDASRLDRAETGGLQRRIGVVFQDFRLIEHLSAFDNVALPLRLAGADDGQVAQHVGELLGWLGLGEVVEKKPPELSIGQRQLVA